MRIYIGFDDTDNLEADFGTGKVARRFARWVPEGCRIWGVVRQQLLVDPRIPYTSHNSSACMVVDLPDPSLADNLVGKAADHIEAMSSPGSDPGLCVVRGGDPSLEPLMELGRNCTRRLVTQGEALEAAGRAHLSGHGGTNDGIIGAAAAVGLTASGWSGRFIEYESLRSFPDTLTVSALEERGIRVVSLDRDALFPRPEDKVHTKGWLRPRLWGHGAVLPVLPAGSGSWTTMGEKRNKS
jgi:tRNA(Ile2) C34 agmatinyltransferase TiaS